MRTVNTKNGRHGLKGRFIVDAFGPLIDISKLAVFSGIEDARLLTEEQLAKKLNEAAEKERSFLERRWNEERVWGVVNDALDSWSLNGDFINSTSLLKLWHAKKNGIDVRIISKVTNEDVFDKTMQAIEAVGRDVSPNSKPPEFEYKRLNDSENALNEYLEKLNNDDPRYTVVLHDSYAMDMQVNPSLVDEWYPSATGRLEDLTPILERGLAREQRMAPIGWLSTQSVVNVSEYKAIGEFIVFSEARRDRLKEQIKRLKETVRNSDKPISVVLCGPSGSGKSFFVNQSLKEIFGTPLEIVKSDLSSVTNLRDAIHQHVIDMRLGDGVALLDEVDTKIGGEFSYRYLMKPMTGSQVDTLGKSVGRIGRQLWFMAGSIANSKHEWIERCKEQEPKVIDWSNRVSEWIEIPGVQSTDALLQALSHLLRCDGDKNIEYATKEALLFFALTEWTDARELRRFVEEICVRHNERDSLKRACLSSESIHLAISHRPDLQKCLAEAEEYNLRDTVQLKR